MFDIWPDKRFIPVRAGDLVRIFHFISVRRRKEYMYRVCTLVEGRLVLVDPIDLAHKINAGVEPALAMKTAFRHDIDLVRRCDLEIIDGEAVQGIPEPDGSEFCHVQYPRERKRIREKVEALSKGNDD